MTPPRSPGVGHLVGLAFAGLLACASIALCLLVPGLVRSTILKDMGLLVTFVAVIALLSLGERVWQLIAARLRGSAPDEK